MSDLATLAADPVALEQYADPGRFVIEACDRAKTWLQQALEHGDIDAIVDTRAQADAIRVYTAQKQHGQDAVLAAQEIVRRAEAGIATALRRAQAAGTRPRPGQHLPRDRDDAAAVPQRNSSVRPIKEYFSGGKAQMESFAMVDDVTNGEFENAIAAAKAEGNLSRANVVRHIGETRPTAPPPSRSALLPAAPTAAPTATRPRRPLPDAFFDASFDLTKVVDRLVRLTRDDRFPRNVNQVAAKHRSDLIRARDALAGVLEQLP